MIKRIRKKAVAALLCCSIVMTGIVPAYADELLLEDEILTLQDESVTDQIITEDFEELEKINIEERDVYEIQPDEDIVVEAEDVDTNADIDNEEVIEENHVDEGWDGVTTEKVYEQGDIKYSFTITSIWSSGYNVRVEIYNNGSEVIDNWAIEMVFPGDITNIWNAVIENRDDQTYTIKNAVWNADIKSGRSVSFGFTGKGDFDKFPESLEIIGFKNTEYDDDYIVDYYLDSDWNNGFVARILITNNSDEPIEDWKLRFCYDREITSIWNGYIESHEGNNYVIKNNSYNANIAPEQTVSFGFNGRGGKVSDEPFDYELCSIGTSEKELDVKKDTDRDGVPDYMEIYYGTDRRNPDTDGDDLTDYQEIVLGTDPLNKDSYDSALDSDGDGMSDLDETGIYKTNPFEIDSDSDGLTDYEEVFKYGTDPLNEDTDEDSLTDGFEVENGLDPNKTSTDGVNEDSNVEIYQRLSKDSISLTIRDDSNIARPSLNGAVCGELSRNVFIATATDLSVIDNPTIIGKAIYIDGDDEYVRGLTLEFDLSRYTENKDNLSIAWLDGEGEYQLIDSSCLKGDLLSCSVDKAGTYFVLDVYEFLYYLGIDLDEELVDSTILAFDDDLNNKQITNVFKIGQDSNRLKTDAVKLNATVEKNTNTNVMGQADIVFAIDTTASMSGAINNVRSNIKTFAEILARDYNINARYSLVDFRDIDCDGKYSTHVVLNGRSNWFTDINSYVKSLNTLGVAGGGDTPESVIDALEMSRNLDYRNNADKFIILVTDASYKISNIYGIKTMQEEIDLLVKDGINTSVVCYPNYIGSYSQLVEKTGGLYADISSSNFSETLMRIASLVGGTSQSGEWVLLKNGLRYVKITDEIDQDGDGFSTVYELGNKAQMNLTSYISYLLMKRGIPMSKYTGMKTIEVYNAKSDPTQKDTDSDGIDDGNGMGDIIDDAPWTKGYADGSIGNLKLVATNGNSNTIIAKEFSADGEVRNTGHTFFAYNSYVNDKINVSEWNGGYILTDDGYILSNDTQYYELYPNNGFTFSAGGDSNLSAACAVYNMELYKRVSPDYLYTYLPNRYFFIKINQSQMDKIIIQMNGEAKKKYNPVTHNCTHVCLGVWNLINDSNVNPRGINSPATLYSYLSSQNAPESFIIDDLLYQ